MKNILLLAATFVLSNTAVAQVKTQEMAERRNAPKMKMDTIFYNRDGERCARETAEEYATVWKPDGGYFNFKRFSLPKHILRAQGQYLNVDSAYKVGTFSEYYESGNLEAKGAYTRNMHSGLWTYYFDSSKPIVWYTRRYQLFDLYDTLKSYYHDGKLKRCEVHQFDILSRKTKQTAAGSDIIVDSKDSIISGQCYDKLGREQKFTPFWVIPKSPYSMNDYLSQNLIYPESAKRNGIQGKVRVAFVITKNGKVSDAHITKRTSPPLDQEGQRVIANMPPWRPALKDDVPVDFKFTQPITFMLED